MITTKGAKIKVKDITNICYGICIFLFVIGQSYLLSSSAILATLCQGLKIVAATVPVLVLLRHSKFSIRNLLLWGLIALLIIGNIFFNQADSDLIYIVIFILYCSKAEPESVLKTYCISAGIAIAIVIFAWLIGILPSQTSAGREYLGFYFATFGPNLFLHTVLAYIASRKNKIKFRSWILIEVINVWFYKMTDTLAVFVVINASIILYYLLNIEKIKQFLFDRDFPRRILEIFPFFSAIATIVAQYFYIAHYNEPAFVAINAAFSNRPYFGKIALETYGVSLFGQPITWLTGTDGTKVSGMDYFYVDSSYLQVLVRYGVIMLVVLCLAMMAVQCYSVVTKNIYLCMGCSLFLIHCITDPQLLSFRYNPFIIISVACVGMIKSKKNFLKGTEMRKNMNKYAEVIVTYNRKKLLKENIEALLNQTFKDHDILIVDNNSNDGTKEMVAEIQDKRIKYYNTGKNLGGAGGFAFGLRKAIELGYLYAWIMDDDSIPEKEALQSLVDKGQALDGEFSYLASLVYWTDGKLFDMNVPDFQYNSRLGLDLDRIRKNKLLLIDTCSFVGCFINLKYAETAGLPISEFFIYGDDQEYTARLRKLAPAYLDFDSVIVHKAPSNKGADVVSADETRIERFFYQARNGMYIARKNGKVGRRLRVIGGRIKNILRKAPDHKAKRVWVTCKGTISGFFFNPKIEYAHRKGE